MSYVRCQKIWFNFTEINTRGIFANKFEFFRALIQFSLRAYIFVRAIINVIFQLVYLNIHSLDMLRALQTFHFAVSFINFFAICII